MYPVEFAESNCVFAEDQPEYLSLPAYRYRNTAGIVISCWRLTIWERFKLLLLGRLWFSTLTFGGPLQPQLPSVDKPEFN